jgi:hypothetical protein
MMARVPNGDFHRVAWAVLRRLPSGGRRRLYPLVIFHPLSLNTKALRALLGRAGYTRIRITNAPLSGPDRSSGGGPALRTILAGLTALGRVAVGAAAALTADCLLLSPSLLAFAEREWE